MKRTLALILAIVMCISLIACGSSADTNPPAENKIPVANNDSNVPGDISVDTEYKKEFVMAEPTATVIWDPHCSNTTPHSRLYNFVYDSLIDLNYATGEFEPRLATSWESEEGGKVWTFKLRDDVVFHNGEPFNSDDVVFSVERGKKSMNPANANLWTIIDTCEAIDEYTVKMTLVSANPEFLYSMSPVYMAMLNRDAFAVDAATGEIDYEFHDVAGTRVDGELNAYLIGTGAFTWEDHVDNDYDSLVRRTDGAYWGEETATERVVQRLIPEASSRLLALEAGEVDLAFDLSNDDLPYVEDNDDLKIVGGESVKTIYLAFNMSKEGVWQDVNFRQAVSKALNRDELVIAQCAGYGAPSYSFYSVSQFGYYASDVHTYDVAAAKDLLAKSGYQGEELEVVTHAGYKYVAMALVDDLVEIGINAVYREENNSNMTPILQAGEQDCHVSGWSPRANGDDFRRHLGTINGRQGFINTPSHDKVLELLDKALITEGDDARKAIYKEIQELIAEECGQIPLIVPTYYSGACAELQGFVYCPDNYYDLRNVQVPLS